MNRQSVIMTAIVTVLLAGVLVACSYYFVQPALQPELSQPEAAPAPPTPEETADKNLIAVSKQMILDAGNTRFDPRDVARNPFLWPGEKDRLLAQARQDAQDKTAEQQAGQAAGNATAGEETGPQHKLKVVMVGEAGKMALIDRKMVFEGDTIGNNTVERIDPLKVVLVNTAQETTTLTMNRAPQMVHLRKPAAVREQQGEQAEQQAAEQPVSVPSEGDDDAKKMEYLLQEIQQMQGS